MTPDHVNALFELFGGVFLLLNVRRLYRDKKINGVSLVPFVFYAAWGYWNVFYYWHLNQTLSWLCGFLPTVANTAWVLLACWYRRSSPFEKAHYWPVEFSELKESSSK